MKKIALLLFVILFLVSCTKDPKQNAINKTKEYVKAINDNNIEKQLEILSGFKLNDVEINSYKTMYKDTVISASSDDISIVYEDKFFIIVKVSIKIEFKNEKAKEVIRYFTYENNSKTKLREILHKLIK